MIGLGLSLTEVAVRRATPTPTPTPTYDFYVDSVNGNDANAGTAAGAAVKTLAALRTKALAFGNGVAVALARGSVWYEDLDLSTLSGVRVEAAGSGAMPILDGSISKANTSFAKTASYTNIYEISVNQTQAEGYISVWENGAMLQFVSSLAALDAAPGSFYIPNDGTGSGKSGPGAHPIYVHASDSSDVTANGKLYEVTDPTRAGRLFVGATATASHVHTRRNLSADGSLQGGIGAYIYGCVMSDGVKHNSLLQSGTYKRCVAWKGENGARTSTILMEFYTANGSGKDCLWDECIAVGSAVNAVNGVAGGGAVNGFSGHNDGVNYYASMQIKDSVAAFCNSGATLAANSVSAVRYRAHECLQGIQGTAYVGANAFTVTDMSYYVKSMMLHRAITSVADVCTIDGFRGYVENSGAAVAGATRTLVFPKAGSTLNLAGSVGYLAGMTTTTTYSFVGGITGGTTLNVSGTISVNATAQDTYTAWGFSSGAGNLGAMDNNVFWTDALTNYSINGVTYGNATNYFTAVRPTKEPNSVIANPSLVSPATGDFTATGVGLPTSSGVQRAVSYLPVPATLAEALAFADAA